MLDPEHAVQKRIVLLGRAAVEPDAPEAVEGLQVGAGHVPGIVPQQSAFERRKISSEGRAGQQRSSRDLAQFNPALVHAASGRRVSHGSNTVIIFGTSDLRDAIW